MMPKLCVTHHHACDCREEAFAKRIAELEAAQQWIPVSERLPTITSTSYSFLVAVDGKHIKPSWFSLDDGWDYADVTHWMPLPAPPEEQ